MKKYNGEETKKSTARNYGHLIKHCIKSKIMFHSTFEKANLT